MIIPEKASCPYCGSQNTSYILYGMLVLDEELERQIERKEVVIGGCVITELSEQWLCQDCKESFGQLLKNEEE